MKLESYSKPSNYGSYSGNDSANRAIAHGLGRVPSIVNILVAGGSQLYLISGALAQVTCINAGTNLAVTAMDATYFYVGNAASYLNSANAIGGTYHWGAA